MQLQHLPMLVDNLERAARVLGHCDAAAREDAIRRALGNLNSEGKLVADAHRVGLLAVETENYNLGKWRLRRGSDLKRLRVSMFLCFSQGRAQNVRTISKTDREATSFRAAALHQLLLLLLLPPAGARLYYAFRHAMPLTGRPVSTCKSRHACLSSCPGRAEE